MTNTKSKDIKEDMFNKNAADTGDYVNVQKQFRQSVDFRSPNKTEWKPSGHTTGKTITK